MTVLRTRSAAIAVAMSFLLGTIALPSLHLAFHDLPHEHEGVPHHHDDHDEDHDHDVDRDHHNADHDADHDHPDAPDPHHGDNSLAHFSVAISDAPASAFELLVAGVVERALIAVITSQPTPAHVAVSRFRGPPVRSC